MRLSQISANRRSALPDLSAVEGPNYWIARTEDAYALGIGDEELCKITNRELAHEIKDALNTVRDHLVKALVEYFHATEAVWANSEKEGLTREEEQAGEERAEAAREAVIPLLAAARLA